MLIAAEAVAATELGKAGCGVCESVGRTCCSAARARVHAANRSGATE